MLYRRTLKSVDTWITHRSLFMEEARKIRAEFEENRNVKDPVKASFLLDRGYYWLNEYPHPETYVLPWMLDGSMYLRSEPLPPEVVQRHSDIP